MKEFDGKLYYTPMEAAQVLKVSYKTVQRWSEKGIAHIWNASNRGRIGLKIRIQTATSVTGYHFYNRKDIDNLKTQIDKMNYSAA